MKTRFYDAFVTIAGFLEAIAMMLIGMFGGTSLPQNKIETKSKKQTKKG